MSSQAFAGRASHLQRGDGNTPTETFVAILELKKISRTGSKADLADVTNMDSGVYREYLPTLLAAGEIAFEGNYIPNDTTQQDLQTDFDTQRLGNWKIALPPAGTYTVTQGTWTFKAYVTALEVPDLQVDKEATTSGKLTITGAPSFTTGH
jgi:Lambda phage tail tube protein, TTP